NRWDWDRYGTIVYYFTSIRSRRYCTIYFSRWIHSCFINRNSSFSSTFSANSIGIFIKRNVTMDIIQIVLFALTSALLYLALKDVQANIAFLIAFLAAIII